MMWIIIQRHPSIPQFRYPTTVHLVLTSSVRIYEVNIELDHFMFSARALIDPATQATFISRKLQRKPDLPIYSTPAATIVGLNGAVVANSIKFV